MCIYSVLEFDTALHFQVAFKFPNDKVVLKRRVYLKSTFHKCESHVFQFNKKYTLVRLSKFSTDKIFPLTVNRCLMRFLYGT